MASGVYEIVNLCNGNRYVGSAVKLNARWRLHRCHLNRGSHHSRHLQAAWNKYGAEHFVFRVLLLCDRQNLIVYEQIMLDALAPEYNTAPVAGSCLGVKRSAETRAKLSVIKMGNRSWTGLKHTSETIAKIRAKHLGVPSPLKGKLRDAAVVAATAAAHTGMKRSAETCERIRAKAIGRVRSLESIEKGAAKRRGVPLSPEHAATLLGNKRAAGKKPTAEENARRSAALKAAWAAKKAAGIPWR